MKKNADSIPLRQAIAVTRRAAGDISKRVPGFFPSCILSSAIKPISTYATIWLSAQLINELASQRRVEALTRWVLLIIGITAGLGLIKSALERWSTLKTDLYRKAYDQMLNEKFLEMDFADADDQKVRDLYTQIQQNAAWRGWGFAYIHMYATLGVEALAGIMGAVALTVSLFTRQVPESAGALTVLNHPLFVVGILGLVTAITLAAPALHNRSNLIWGRVADEARFGNRAFSHFYFFSEDVKKTAKDVRIYSQLDMAVDYTRDINVFGVGSSMDRINKTSVGIYDGLAGGVSALLSGMVYVFVCLKALGGAFGIGSVTQYVSAVTTLTSNLSSLLTILGHMRVNAEFLGTAYEFLDLPNSMYQGSLTTEKRADREYDIEFRDVSFKYPGSDLWALRHVNMKFRVGSRLAIVGENGSGKTTFIKLLCRLYDPTEGEILLNGIDIRKYRYDDYIDVFSVVFQDFKLISQSLGSNVAGSIAYDRDRVMKSLTDAGFAQRLDTMDKGLDTMLYRSLSDDGVEVSGGEAQKIAIARALYKDAPFIILDEPTAALDPIAEAEIYEKFNEIAGDKTAIYISHRLSTCKFCDEIAVFHDGQVIQQGSHNSLLADAAGKYHQLWHAQAQYYVEEGQYK